MNRIAGDSVVEGPIVRAEGLGGGQGRTKGCSLGNVCFRGGLGDIFLVLGFEII